MTPTGKACGTKEDKIIKIKKKVGHKGGRCYGNGTCNEGLECRKNRCRVSDAEPEPEPARDPCPVGKVMNADTDGNCCWPGQAWQPQMRACVGTPSSCPDGYEASGSSCVLPECAPGKVRQKGAPECCWPGQAYSSSREMCLGAPRCPKLFVAIDSTCKRDRDLDGILDEDDSCPGEPEDFDELEDADGCPDTDVDSDNVADDADECPTTPEDRDGFEDDDGCPDEDNDGDGIDDDRDVCPNEPENFDGIDDLDGCPDRDSDGDKISDDKDHCPGAAEDRDGFEDSDGCPDRDNDDDGRPDTSDSCPNEAEDIDGFEDADGCPDYDNDRDGVLDSNDECPDEIEDQDGYRDTDGCIDADNDGDSIADAQDSCPNDPEDSDGFEDTDGCPDKDNDGDGIVDASDRCPDQEETLDGFLDEDGCPDAQDMGSFWRLGKARYDQIGWGIEYAFAPFDDPVFEAFEVGRIARRDVSVYGTFHHNRLKVHGRAGFAWSDQSVLETLEQEGYTEQEQADVVTATSLANGPVAGLSTMLPLAAWPSPMASKFGLIDLSAGLDLRMRFSPQDGRDPVDVVPSLAIANSFHLGRRLTLDLTWRRSLRDERSRLVLGLSATGEPRFISEKLNIFPSFERAKLHKSARFMLSTGAQRTESGAERRLSLSAAATHVMRFRSEASFGWTYDQAGGSQRTKPVFLGDSRSESAAPVVSIISWMTAGQLALYGLIFSGSNDYKRYPALAVGTIAAVGLGVGEGAVSLGVPLTAFPKIRDRRALELEFGGRVGYGWELEEVAPDEYYDEEAPVYKRTPKANLGIYGSNTFGITNVLSLYTEAGYTLVGADRGARFQAGVVLQRPD